MSGSCEASLVQFGIWLGEIIRSLFPWPAIVLFAFLFLRCAMLSIESSCLWLTRCARCAA